MSRQSSVAKLVDMLVARRERDIRCSVRQMTLDFAVIALGRLGWGEKRLNDFCKIVEEVSDEYSEMIIADSLDDKNVEYSKAKLDEELKQYCGKSFCPYDGRYTWWKEDTEHGSD